MTNLTPLTDAGYLVSTPIERPVTFTINVTNVGTYSTDNTWQIRESNNTILDLTQTYPIAASTITAGNDWTGWGLNDVSVISNVSPTSNYSGTYVFDSIDAYGDGWSGNWELTVYSTDANGVSSFRLSTLGPGTNSSLKSEFLVANRYVLATPLTQTILKNILAVGNGYTIQQLVEIDLFTLNDVHALFTTIDDIHLLTTPDYGSQNISQLLTLGYSRLEIHYAGFSIWLPRGSSIAGGAAGDNLGHSVAVSEYGNIIATGAPFNDGINGINTGQVRVYNDINDTWAQIGQDIEGETAGDNSGQSISLSSDGTIVAVGSPYHTGVNGGESGHVRVYEYGALNDVMSWNMRGNPIDGEAASDESGTSVSLSNNGNILAIGSPFNATNGVGSGHTRVYEYINGNWIQRGSTINGESGGDFSGGSVSLNGDGSIIAIGAYGAVFNSGNVRIYEYGSTDWVQRGGNIVGESGGNFSGNSVSLNSTGNVVAIGAYGNTNQRGSSGHVRIYGYDSNKTQEELSQYSSYFGPVGWSRIGSDIDGESSSDYSGYSVSLYSESSVLGAIVAIGAFGNDSNGIDSGHVRIYKLHYSETQGASWAQFGIDIDGTTTGDNSGKAVALSGDGTIVMIGAPASDPNNMDGAGQVRAFRYAVDTTPPVISLNGDVTLTTTKGDTYTDAGATALDDLTGDITSYMITTGTVDTATIGTYTIVYNISDFAGNAAVPVTRTVVVVLNSTPPVISLIGNATITIMVGDTYIDAGATAMDNIDGTITGNITTSGTVNTAIAGTYLITYTVTDSDGNVAIPVTRTIVVIADLISPSIVLIGDVTITLMVGNTYTDAGATATDNIDGTITGSIITTGAVNTAVAGTYTITYNVSDAAGNAATPIIRTVIVLADTTPPTISLVGDTTITLMVGDTYTDAGATATDNINGTITGNIITTGTVNTAVPGTYTITYNVSDAAGNAATPIIRTVIVLADTTPPVISLIGAATIALMVDDTYTDAGATATDNIDGTITGSIITTGAVNTAVAGTYTITYNVSDAAGNVATPVIRTIIVSIPPPTTKTLAEVTLATTTLSTSSSFINYLTGIGVSNTTGIYNQNNTIENDPYIAYKSTITIPYGNFNALSYANKSELINNLKTWYAIELNVNANNFGVILRAGSIIIEVTILNDNIINTELPNVPICFPKGTQVTVDQGKITIETLRPDIHTIHGRKIIAISQTRPLQKHLICFEQDSLGKNIPSQETLCSKEHKIFYKGEMKTASEISEVCENVTEVPYHGDPLYNVLLEKHDKMVINNMICETLHPKNIMAKISMMKDGPEKSLAVRKLNQRIAASV
jgi:hypothetical protein